jgi:hypothetical protein
VLQRQPLHKEPLTQAATAPMLGLFRMLGTDRKSRDAPQNGYLPPDYHLVIPHSIEATPCEKSRPWRRSFAAGTKTVSFGCIRL